MRGTQDDMKPFVVNRHGRLVFPSNFLPELDFSVLDGLEALDAVIARDFEAKAPTGTDILERVESGGYEDRFELMRDVALNLVWVNRYAMTMYEKRPTRWRDVPRRRDDVFLPILTPWEEGERKVAAVADAFGRLAGGPDAGAEERIFAMLFDVFANRRHHATELPAIKPTVAEILEDPANLTFRLPALRPRLGVFGFEGSATATRTVPRLESLHRLAMVLHDQYPWDRAATRARRGRRACATTTSSSLFAPRNPDVLDFIRRVKGGARRARAARRPAEPRRTGAVRPYPPVDVARALRGHAAARGARRGQGRARLHQRRPDPQRRLLVVADDGRGHRPQDGHRGAPLHRARARRDRARGGRAPRSSTRAASPRRSARSSFCTCTSTTLIPSVASWLSGQLGIFQTHASFDLIAACAGFPYGLAEATRLLQEVQRPGARRLRGEVLRQDRRRAHVAHDLRRRRRRRS